MVMEKRYICSFIIFAVLASFFFNMDHAIAACSHSNYKDVCTKITYSQTSKSHRYYKKYHIKRYYYKRTCKNCNAVLSNNICKAVWSAHSFKNNQCSLCKYKKNSASSNTTTNTLSNSQANSTTVVGPKVTYKYNTKGNYIFVNNPEAIRDTYLMDAGKEWLYGTSFSGKTRIFLEHTALDVADINYGIQIYNPNSYQVSVIFYKGAAAIDDSSVSKGYKEVWENFEDTDFGFSNISENNAGLVLKAKGSCWLFPDGAGGWYVTPTQNTMDKTYPFSLRNYKITNSIEGLVDLYASSSVRINFGAFKNFSKVNMNQVATYYCNKNEYSDYDTNSSHNDEKVYSGNGYAYPLAESVMAWSIDDSITGNLNVKLDDYRQSDHWETCNSHTIKNTEQILSSSIYPLYIPIYYNNKGKWYMIAVDKKDPRSNRSFNWADYGVTYKHKISITNKGKRSRNVTYQLSWDQPACGKTIIYKYNNEKAAVFRYGKNDETQKNLKTVILPAGKTTTFTMEVTLGGMSDGGLCHALILK